MASLNEDYEYLKIIESVASIAAYQVEGVASLSNEAGAVFQRNAYVKKGKNSVTAYFKNNQVVLDIYLNAYHNYKVPNLALAVQQRVKDEVEKATSYKVKDINIHIVGIVFPV